jgi:hypothetical protein
MSAIQIVDVDIASGAQDPQTGMRIACESRYEIVGRERVAALPEIPNNRHLLEREVAQNGGGSHAESHDVGRLAQSLERGRRFDLLILGIEDGIRVYTAAEGLLELKEQNQVGLKVTGPTYGEGSALAATKLDLDGEE